MRGRPYRTPVWYLRVVETAEYINHVESEGRALGAASKTAGFDAAVPTCPGWTITELLRHVSYVHQWATRYVRDALTEMQPNVPEVDIISTGPSGHELLASYETGLTELVGALRGAPPDLACWSFLREGSPLDQWARRQAHETTIHRADAELSAHRHVSAVTPTFALDGIDELLSGFWSRDLPDERRVTIGIRLDDADEQWAVDLSETRAHGRRSPDVADTWISASASDIYFALWHRAPLSPLDRDERPEWLDLWERRGVRW